MFLSNSQFVSVSKTLHKIDSQATYNRNTNLQNKVTTNIFFGNQIAKKKHIMAKLHEKTSSLTRRVMIKMVTIIMIVIVVRRFFIVRGSVQKRLPFGTFVAVTRR